MDIENKTKSKLHNVLFDEGNSDFSYSRPTLKYFNDKSNRNPSGMKSSFKLFQAMTLGDTSDASNLPSFISAGGSKYKPKIFEILKNHS